MEEADGMATGIPSIAHCVARAIQTVCAIVVATAHERKDMFDANQSGSADALGKASPRPSLVVPSAREIFLH